MAGLIIAPRARIFHGHEWVYATEIKKSFGDPQPGDVVTLKDFRDRPLGSAIYNPNRKSSPAASRAAARTSIWTFSPAASARPSNTASARHR
jgi:23S rRNA G2069 N7-methylase RlmK/C1962 C5-methylase RlmI